MNKIKKGDTVRIVTCINANREHEGMMGIITNIDLAKIYQVKFSKKTCAATEIRKEGR